MFVNPSLNPALRVGAVGSLVASVAHPGPKNSTVSVAGPDRVPFAETVARYLKSAGDTRTVATDRDARYYS
ncbi:hypothetical protein WJ06_02250 [Burkholderia cepacia]|uniref:hypothetical protein n=1 Tax=Burkholderia cepacia TaxID=292 RepID=UPI00075CED66|nr:hypothetical protein WJ06_02250 [Burkholderia cepacia]